MGNEEKEKKELVEQFGIHFNRYHNLPPLTARIMGILIVNCSKEGLTFQELVTRTDASKSSVSTSLNHLLELGKIMYYNLPDDRKKYFRPKRLVDRMDSHLRVINSEVELIEKMRAFSLKYQDPKNSEEFSGVVDTYLKYTTKIKKTLEEASKELTKKEQKLI